MCCDNFPIEKNSLNFFFFGNQDIEVSICTDLQTSISLFICLFLSVTTSPGHSTASPPGVCDAQNDVAQAADLTVTMATHTDHQCVNCWPDRAPERERFVQKPSVPFLVCWISSALRAKGEPCRNSASRPIWQTESWCECYWYEKLDLFSPKIWRSTV